MKRKTITSFLRKLVILFLGTFFFCDVVCYATEDVTSLHQISKVHHLHISSPSREELVLKGNKLELKFKNSSRTFWVNNVIIPLGFPCSIKRGRMVISRADYKTHVLPFFSTEKKNFSSQSTIIVLDPGHGGRDNGAVFNGVKEKIITLDIAKKVAQNLSKHGYKVLFTRKSDVSVPLEQRANFANRNKATIFVSIHCNSAQSALASGIETFSLTPCGQPSHGKSFRSSRDLRIFANNGFDKENLLLAYHVQRNILQRTHSIDRGVKHERFFVLKPLGCPGILVECGFLSNINELKNLTSDRYREILAESISAGIIEFLK